MILFIIGLGIYIGIPHQLIDDHIGWTLIFMIIGGITRTIQDVSINIFLIVSLMDENKYYHLCKYCHNGCLYCCSKLAKNDEAEDDWQLLLFKQKSAMRYQRSRSRVDHVEIKSL